MKKQQKPFGHWNSSISAKMLAAKSTRLGQMQLFAGDVYWQESRPEEKGRGVIVVHQAGENKDITPKKYSVRTKAHEYGGGEFWGCDDFVIFANEHDQRLYQQDLNTSKVKPITSKPDFKHAWRYCDGDVSPNRQFTVCVRERHQENGTAFEVVNDLISIDLTTNEVTVIASGEDFYSNPRISPNGNSISWISWNHPNMPWDETSLWKANLSSKGSITDTQLVVGADNVSVYNPQWSAQNHLFYVADNNGWWHIYQENQLEPVHEFREIEFGLPQWVFGCNSFQILDQKTIIALGTSNGVQNLYKINIADHSIINFQDHWNAYSGQFIADDRQLAFIAATTHNNETIIRLGLDENKVESEVEDLLSADSQTALKVISTAQHMQFSTTKDDTAYGYFYAPSHHQYQSDDELPPLIVMSHGGPTGMTDAGYDLQIQYWTNRGFAVADVNYRGSSGYGRKYRDRLKGQWGIFDVDDCIAMAKHLDQLNLIDINRLAIRGGSAGGFTTLCALTFHNNFKVGMSRYGVADLLSLAQDSHKFEIRYLDTCVGPLPEAKNTYLARSPSEHTDQLSCPILILQGSDDKVVPPSQSEAMVSALEAKGLPYQYIEFEGEGHGFRKPETIIQAFEAELEFYRKYLL